MPAIRWARSTRAGATRSGDGPVPPCWRPSGAVTERRMVALRAMTSDGWEAPTDTPVGPGTYALFMEIRIFDCWVHEQDIRRALDRPGHLEGPIADVAMARLSGSLGFVVGKRVGAPE